MFCPKETQDLLANKYVPGQTEPLYMILYVHKELTDALEILTLETSLCQIVRTKLDSAALEDSNHRYPLGTEKTIYGHLLL